MKTKLAILILFTFLFIACPPPSNDISIEICLEHSVPIKARSDCPETEVRKYPRGTLLAPCTLKHASPIEYVERFICVESGLLEHTYCPPEQIIKKKFVKGTEPLTWCSFHKEPDPPFIYPEVIEDIHAGFLGIHLWWISEAWEAANFEATMARLKETLHEIRIRQIGTMDFFLWASDGKPEHKHFNRKTPYLPLVGGQFDLSKWQPRYFELFEAFVAACKEHDIRPAPHLFMDRYNYGPFEHNINGVRRFWIDKAFPFQAAFAEKICQILDKHFDNYWIKPINEAAHGGSRDMFHTIGDWHRDIWDDVLSKHIKIDRLIVDVSMSEGGQMYLNEPLLCGKPYEEGEMHGDPSRDRTDVTKSILAETHSISTIKSYEESEVDLFWGSKWRRYKIHGDGSWDGNIQLANTGFRQGDASETYDFGVYVWTIAKRKGKQFIYAIFPMESFRDDNGNWNLWFENYNKDNILWGRIDALVRAWKTIYVERPDPPEPFPPKYETYSINWIGLLPWMVMKEMAGIDIDEDIETLIEKSRRTGASYIHSFCWIGEPGPENGYTQHAIPWLWIDGKVDFTTVNPEYEIQFKFLVETCKKYDMEFRPIFFMARYNYHIFRSDLNHNGIRDFYTPKAMAIQRDFISDCIRWLKEVEGQDYRPTVLLMNEPAHYGDDEMGHIIADWHMEQGDYVLQWTDPIRLWVDGSHSEYAHAWFVGPHECPKPWNHEETFLFGREEYSHRPVHSESHGSSTLEGFLDNGFDMWAGSAWTHGAFNEDGSGSGSKLCDGIPAFRQANTEEYTIALTYGRDNKGNRILYIIAFPFDPIKNAREDYSKAFVLTYDWARLNVYANINK